MTGVSLGAAFGPSSSGAAGLPDHSVSVSAADHSADAAGQADSTLDRTAAKPATSHRASPADLPRHAAVSAHVGHPAAARHQAPAKHQATARHDAAKAAVVRHAPVKPAARPKAASHPAARQQPKAHPTAIRRAAPVAPTRPYEIYDSVTPAQIPAHHVIATYATGNYAASPSEVAGRHVMWIDTTGSDYAASVLDVEPGDATPSLAANWAYHRLSEHRTGLARIYTMISEWPAVKSAVATLPSWMQSHVRWWIADPTGTPHIVPGAAATQWYWGSNYDITSASPRF